MTTGSDPLQEMFAVLSTARKEVLPSKYWEELNKKNLEQLQTRGYENFKRTLALNYFTFLLKINDEQIKYLIRNLPKSFLVKSIIRTLFSKSHKYFSWKKSVIYNLHAYLLWEFVYRNDEKGILNELHEPVEGNPPKVYLNKKLISQDLSNSVLEYQAIEESGINTNNIETIMELGGGYGRTAFVFLSLMPRTRYIMVDIPPALYIAQRYLSSQFPQKRIFRFRAFSDYSVVRDEMVNSEIVFLLPNQLDCLPDKIADLFINISSLHEMRLDQIEYYFSLIDRLTARYFYFKQWKESIIPFENVKITENDYPIRNDWAKIFWRECKVQTRFFEALYRVGG